MTLVILLIGLIVATSFIAYWADNLGKKLGKKRISLFGIRPKQTATLISIISSVGIMLLTVGVLMAAFSNLRNALLRYDNLRDRNSQLVKNNDKLVHQQQTLNNQLTSLKQAATSATKQRTAALAQLAKIEADLKKASKAEQQARQGEKAAKQKADSAQKRYTQIAQKLVDAQKKVASSQQLLAESLNKLQSTNKSLSKANSDYKAAHLQLTKANEQLLQTQQNLASVQRNFELVDQQVRSTLDQYREAVQNVERLKKRSEDLETELRAQQQQLYELSSVANRLATGNVELAYGTVFAQTLIPSKTNSDVAKAQLQTLLEAGQNAVQGKYNLYLAQPDVNIPGDQIIEYIANQLSASDVTISARLVAARDHAVGEQNVSTRFILVPVRTIFQKDDVIEESQIDSQLSDALIFNQLLRLVDEGESIARQRGSMPIATEGSPFYAAGTNERIFEALRKIQQNSGTVNVKMLASQNITTIDAMHVKFIVTATTESS